MRNVGPQRRTFLRAMAGAPALLLFPSLSVAACGRPGPSGGVASLDADRVGNADAAAQLVVGLAEEASRQGTFGVGGAIIDNATGRVIKAMRNRVLQPLNSGLGELSGKVYTSDPTAHGERQLVSWYYANAREQSLPSPDKLTVVTSLDPCAMCAGSLTTAGFNAAVVASDAKAGINFTEKFDFPGMPNPIASKLKRLFGYYAVDGGRRYFGGDSVLYRSESISASSLNGCSRAFENSVDAVRAAAAMSGLDPRDPANAMVDPASSPMKELWRKGFADAFAIKLVDYRRPTPEVKRYLEGIRDQASGARNAVAFFDYFGNLLMAAPDRFDISPIASALMNTLQSYSKMRFDLVNNPATSSSARKAMSSFKYGTFVFLHAPDGADPTTLKDLGAFGSAMEGAVPVEAPSNFQYFEDPRAGSIDDLHALIAAMPPLYRELIGINPQRVR